MNSHLRVVAKSRSPEGTIVVSIRHARVQVAPSSHRDVLIPEPFSCHLLEVVTSHVGTSGSNLGAADQSIEVGGLSAVMKGDGGGRGVLKQVIKEFVSGPKHLRLIDLYHTTFTYCA